MLDALLLFLSFPVFQGVIIDEPFSVDVILEPEEELFLNKSDCALANNVHADIVAKMINIEVKDITKINLSFIV
jgi:hypothetical protein